MSEVKRIDAEAFLKLPTKQSTILDVREPDEVLVYPIQDAVNIPFSKLSAQIDTIPKSLPVYVLCSTGDLSEEVAEILADRDYDVTNVEGGVSAIRRLQKAPTVGEQSASGEFPQKSDTAPAPSEPVRIDAKGLKCPGPIVKVADTIRSLQDGEQVIVEATEDAFASDTQVWCERTGNKLLQLKVDSGVITATLQKSVEKNSGSNREFEHEKTFVVFSNDLDKVIAAFIMANGSAAMGRKVTLFFTFWGLNVLRRPEKVSVKKDLIGRMFGLMMPRGTRKLGLSQMNMGGAGAWMIRSVMKKNGISSVEELMQNAIDHGVRLVACQMSMDIMGIKQEELIDGVELGGVASMLGSAEKSDLTYFI